VLHGFVFRDSVDSISREVQHEETGKREGSGVEKDRSVG